ncbi:hypothetical protein VTO73DRAFT_14221 [Trametes versicolor]
MPPRKRAAEDDSGAGPTTRSAKTPKTEKAAKGRAKRGPKANLGASSFKARALPLHLNLTHTPPILGDDGTVSLASTDPGFLGTSTLLPSTFATGSYGWKGSKRLTIELQNPEGGEEKEKVHVMLTINATVIGSKGAKDDEGEGEAKEEGGEEAADAEAEKAVEDAVAEEAEDAKETNGDSKGAEAMEETKDA